MLNYNSKIQDSQKSGAFKMFIRFKKLKVVKKNFKNNILSYDFHSNQSLAIVAAMAMDNALHFYVTRHSLWIYFRISNKIHHYNILIKICNKK